MEEIMPNTKPREQTTNPLPEQRAVREEPVEGKKNPRTEYFKMIAITLGVFLVVPVVLFLILLPLLLPLMSSVPLLFSLLPLGFLAYFGVAAYWFFKKGMYQKMMHSSMKWGLQRSKRMMENMPEDLKQDINQQIAQSEQGKAFKEQIKAEMGKEMQEEMKKKQQETDNTNY